MPHHSAARSNLRSIISVTTEATTSTRKRKPASTNVVRKMSSIDTRDWTKFRLSVARSSPATPVHRTLANIR